MISSTRKRALLRQKGGIELFSLWFIGVFILCTFLVRSFFYEPFRIPSGSMSPTLEVGDYILVKKFGYGNYGTFGLNLNFLNSLNNSELERGEMYVFHYSDTETKFVKRLIGVPGDTLLFKEGEVFVNGAKLQTTFLADDFEFIYLEESLLNKAYGIKKSVQHKRKMDRSTIVPDDSYFFIGDNRDNSADSRHRGTVHSSGIVGRVDFIF